MGGHLRIKKSWGIEDKVRLEYCRIKKCWGIGG
jgi:hypothetical protein